MHKCLTSCRQRALGDTAAAEATPASRPRTRMTSKCAGILSLRVKGWCASRVKFGVCGFWYFAKPSSLDVCIHELTTQQLRVSGVGLRMSALDRVRIAAWSPQNNRPPKFPHESLKRFQQSKASLSLQSFVSESVLALRLLHSELLAAVVLQGALLPGRHLFGRSSCSQFTA